MIIEPPNKNKNNTTPISDNDNKNAFCILEGILSLIFITGIISIIGGCASGKYNSSAVDVIMQSTAYICGVLMITISSLAFYIGHKIEESKNKNPIH